MERDPVGEYQANCAIVNGGENPFQLTSYSVGDCCSDFEGNWNNCSKDGDYMFTHFIDVNNCQYEILTTYCEAHYTCTIDTIAQQVVCRTDEAHPDVYHCSESDICCAGNIEMISQIDYPKGTTTSCEIWADCGLCTCQPCEEIRKPCEGTLEKDNYSIKEECDQDHDCVVDAEVCNNGLDDDCDGDADCNDPDCPPCPPCSDSAAASTLEASLIYSPSDLSKHLAYFLLPIGAVIAMTFWRRKR